MWLNRQVCLLTPLALRWPQSTADAFGQFPAPEASQPPTAVLSLPRGWKNRNGNTEARFPAWPIWRAQQFQPSSTDQGSPEPKSALTIRLMQPLPRSSVSPLPSFCTRPDVVPRYQSFAEIVTLIWRHLSGRPKPTLRERQLETAMIERLAAEMEIVGETETPISMGER
jgi:hypothetical protein